MMDGPCRDCGRSYQPWFTEHALWNVVLGGPTATDDPGGLLCPVCFMDLARIAGEGPLVWHLTGANA